MDEVADFAGRLGDVDQQRMPATGTVLLGMRDELRVGRVRAPPPAPANRLTNQRFLGWARPLVRAGSVPGCPGRRPGRPPGGRPARPARRGTGARSHRGQPCGPAATRRPPGDRPHRPPHGVGGINGQPTSFLPAVRSGRQTHHRPGRGDRRPHRPAGRHPATTDPRLPARRRTWGSRPRSLHHPGRRTAASPARLRDRHSCTRPSSGLPRRPPRRPESGRRQRRPQAHLGRPAGSNRAGYTEAKSAFIEQALAASPPRP